MMADKKILAQDVADKIMEMITKGRFKEGDKLPNENEFSKELSVSRSTLREASRMLSTYGFLKAERGRGTFVTHKALEGRIKPDLSAFSYDKAALKDLYEVRLILEPEAAFLAAKRATDEELKHIRTINDRIEKEIYKHIDRTMDEQEFHASIALATHNSIMRELLPPMNKAILQGVNLSKLYKRVAEETLYDHRTVTDFLCNRNAEGAKTAMKLHILHAIDSLHLK